MKNYRIREEIIPQFEWGKSEPKPAVKKYYVERRILWFFWIPDNLGLNNYNVYSYYIEAVEHVIKRNGKLLYIC